MRIMKTTEPASDKGLCTISRIRLIVKKQLKNTRFN